MSGKEIAVLKHISSMKAVLWVYILLVENYCLQDRKIMSLKYPKAET